MQVVQKWPKVYRLTLDATAIGDAGVGYLSKLPVLRVLSLRESRVTDRSLTTFAQMKTLGTLYLNRAPLLTPAAVDALKAQMPNVVRYP